MAEAITVRQRIFGSWPRICIFGLAASALAYGGNAACSTVASMGEHTVGFVQDGTELTKQGLGGLEEAIGDVSDHYDDGVDSSGTGSPVTFTSGGGSTTPALAAGGTPAATVRSFDYTTLTGVDVTCTGVAGTGEGDDEFKREQPQLTGIGGWVPTGAEAARAAGVDTTPGSCRRS